MIFLNVIFLYFYGLMLISLNHLNWEIINLSLFLLIILSIINLLECLVNASLSAEGMQKSFQKTIKNHSELIENMRRDLFIERVRANFLAMMYFSITGKNNEFDFAKKQLLELGLDKKIISNPNEFDLFFQKLVNKKIIINFDKTTKKFILEEKVINNNNEK